MPNGHLLTLEVAAALIPMASATNLRSWLGRNKELFPPKYTCRDDCDGGRGRHLKRRVLTEDEVLVIRGLVILQDQVRAPVPGAPRHSPIRFKALFDEVEKVSA